MSSVSDGARDYIALEDLSYKGYRTCSRGTGLNLNHSLLVIKALGEFHAASLAWKDQNSQQFEAATSSLRVSAHNSFMNRSLTSSSFDHLHETAKLLCRWIRINLEAAIESRLLLELIGNCKDQEINFSASVICCYEVHRSINDS